MARTVVAGEVSSRAFDTGNASSVGLEATTARCALRGTSSRCYSTSRAWDARTVTGRECTSGTVDTSGLATVGSLSGWAECARARLCSGVAVGGAVEARASIRRIVSSGTGCAVSASTVGGGTAGALRALRGTTSGGHRTERALLARGSSGRESTGGASTATSASREVSIGAQGAAAGARGRIRGCGASLASTAVGGESSSSASRACARGATHAGVTALTVVALGGTDCLREGAGRTCLASTVARGERSDWASLADVRNGLGTSATGGAAAGSCSTDGVHRASLASATVARELTSGTSSASVSCRAEVTAGARCAFRGASSTDCARGARTAYGVVCSGEGASRAGVTDSAASNRHGVGLSASRAVRAGARASRRNGANRAQAAVIGGGRELSSRAGLASGKTSVGTSAAGARLASGCASQTEGVGGAWLALAGGRGELACAASHASSAPSVRLVASRARHTAARARG